MLATLASGLGFAFGSAPQEARAFGDAEAFHPRVLLTGNAQWRGARTTAPARWSAELLSRTSAPAKTAPTTVRADEPTLLAEPFVVWGGETDVPPLTEREVGNVRNFLALGGILLVDDFAPESGAFLQAAKREVRRVLPEASPIDIGPETIVFRTFYLLKRAVGRTAKRAELEAVIRGGVPQVLFSANDLLGALARGPSGTPPFAVTPDGETQREHAVRLAVNIALYVLCSTYKEDLVHQSFLKRRRSVEP